MRSRSILSVLFFSRVSPNRYENRLTWVSTTTPALILKALPSTTLAVFGPLHEG